MIQKRQPLPALNSGRAVAPAARPVFTDWIEEGRKHFLATKLHPGKLNLDHYPTQDVHTPKDEADFIAGVRQARSEWERDGGLNGLSAYMREIEEAEEAGRAPVIIVTPASVVV